MLTSKSLTLRLLGASVFSVAVLASAEVADRSPSYYAYVSQRHAAFFIPLEAHGSLTSRDLRTGETRTLYRVESSQLFAVKPSPGGDRIAFLERILKYNVKPGEANFTETVSQGGGASISGFEDSVLRVLDLGGSMRASVNQVRDFAWSPDGSHIVLATGRYVRHYEGFADTATWLLDLSTGTKTRLADGGNYVTWPQFDGNIYIWITSPERFSHVRVVRVLIPDGRLEPTELKSIYFSPTGTYYYRPIADAGREGIFRTADQTELNAPGLTELSPFEPLGWNQEKDILWIRVNQRRRPGGPIEPRDVLYDVGKDAAMEIGQGIVGWAGGSGMLRQGVDGPVMERVQ